MIRHPSQFFNVQDTLVCGQTFRFKPYEKGYLVYAGGEACYCYNEGDSAFIQSDNDDFWFDYFCLGQDYKTVVEAVLRLDNPIVSRACQENFGVRILKQDGYEALISFIVSQNNNIPRIKSSIERLCAFCGEKKSFAYGEYYAFPTPERLSKVTIPEFTALGFGYRAEYLYLTAQKIVGGEINIKSLSLLPTKELKARLLEIKGVGDKVADCVLLFGFRRGDCFPVDTWIEKLYREDFGGTLKDRKKIAEYFVSAFGENSGIIQQYLFFEKRKQSGA